MTQNLKQTSTHFSSQNWKHSLAHLLALALMVFVAAALRVLPHPPNFSPVGALALFGGAYLARPLFTSWWGRLALAIVVPLMALFLSDLALGFHGQMVAVYAAFVLVAVLGFWALETRSVIRVGACAVSSSLIFFAITNLTVWAEGTLYPRTLAGLASSYIAGLPFLENSLVGDMFFSAVLFGAWAWLEKAALQPKYMKEALKNGR